MTRTTFAWSLLVPGLLLSANPLPVLAGSLDETKLALHVAPRSAKASAICTSESPNALGIPCSEYVIRGAVGVGYSVYLVATGYDPNVGLGGISCGLDYDGEPASGIDISEWTRCVDLDFPNGTDLDDPGTNWPASGGGNRMVWGAFSNCQKTEISGEGGHAVAGAFYVYAYGEDIFTLTPNLNIISGPELAVADCSAALSSLPLTATGFVRFSEDGVAAGCNPCLEECVTDSICVVDPEEGVVDLFAFSGCFSDRTISLHNSSEDSFTGDARLEECNSAFTIISGGGPFTVAAGETWEIGVRFTAPLSAFEERCLLATGNSDCGKIRIRARSSSSVCERTGSRDLGIVGVGESVQRQFTYSNRGCQDLTGVFGLSGCSSDISLVEEGESFRLAPGESRTVTVVFAPTRLGFQSCELLSDGEFCPTRISGEGRVPMRVLSQSINPKSKGVVPVAVYSTDEFDATTIDPLDVRLRRVDRFFGDCSPIPTRPEAHEKIHIADLNGDKLKDALLHFRTGDVSFDCGDAALFVQGRTQYGSLFCTVADSIKTVGCPKEDASTAADEPIERVDPEPGTVSRPGNLRLLTGPTETTQRLEYEADGNATVRLNVYSVTGRLIRELVFLDMPKGTHSVGWNTTGVADGVYFYKFAAGPISETLKVLILGR